MLDISVHKDEKDIIWAVGDPEGSSREFEFRLSDDDYCSLEDLEY